VEATDEITVRMTAAEWNQAMAILAEGPYRIVAPLLTKIQQQALAQDNRAAQDGQGRAAPSAGEGEGPRVQN
jgi:hypothetical protein